MTLLQQCDLIQPVLCRILARKKHGRSPLSHSEIAKLSGLKKALVAKLSYATTWKGQRIEVIEAFSHACDVNLIGNARENLRLKERLKAKMMHIHSGNITQKRFYRRLFEILHKSRAKSG